LPVINTWHGWIQDFGWIGWISRVRRRIRTWNWLIVFVNWNQLANLFINKCRRLVAITKLAAGVVLFY
jgi:hypothetical protein